MAASMAENTPSNTIDNEPDSSPNTTPNSETTTVTPIDRRSRRCSAVASGMPPIIRQRRSNRKDQAGRRTVRQKLAGAVIELAFRGADARTDVDHLALGLHRTGLVGHGAHVVHLDLDRGVADAGLERGVDAATHHRIEQGGGDAAMHGAEGIIMVVDWRVVEDDTPCLDLRYPEAQRRGDR